MKDNEIIKALECCMDEMGCTKGCPCFDPKAKASHCTVSKKLELEKLTLDLINRQKAEIERLKAFEKNVYETVKELRNKIKTEAIKEFAERLKEKSFYVGSDFDWLVEEKDIDNLVKETVSENNG